MVIDGIGSIDPLQKIDGAKRQINRADAHAKDAVSLSEDAKEQAALHRVNMELKKIPDIREDRVAEVKARLEDPGYPDDTVIDAVADRLLDAFGLEQTSTNSG